MFFWSTDSYDVAEFVSPGRLALKAPGQVVVIVRTKHTSLKTTKTVLAR
jgi:hypothetical protein